MLLHYDKPEYHFGNWTSFWVYSNTTFWKLDIILGSFKHNILETGHHFGLIQTQHFGNWTSFWVNSNTFWKLDIILGSFKHNILEAGHHFGFIQTQHLGNRISLHNLVQRFLLSWASEH
jgi:hypothetical protein